MIVLLRGLSFSNGVALNKDSDFVLITETTTSKVIRYWPRGKKSQTSLHNLLDVQMIFKETLVGSFGLHKIIVKYKSSKSSR